MPVKSNAPISIGLGYQQRGIGNYFTMDGGYAFIDIKTTIPQQSYVMPMIELIGYNYGVAQPIRMAFVLYTYAYLIANWEAATTGGGTGYAGVSGSSVYISADGYVCLRVSMGSSYFCGFSLDAYSVAGNGPGYEIGILAAAANNAKGNYY